MTGKGEFGLVSLWNILSPFGSLTSVFGLQEGHLVFNRRYYWFVGGDDLTGALQVFQLQLSPPPPSPLAPVKSRMPTLWYQLTTVVPENGC